MSEPIRKQIRVRCDPSRAFEVFTSRIDAWWPRSHRKVASSRLVIEPWPSGRFVEIAEGGEEVELGRVLAWDPPRALSYTWRPGAITGPTTVEVRFAAEGDATLVSIVHSEGEAAMGAEWPRRAERFDRSWDQVLPALARGIEEG